MPNDTANPAARDVAAPAETPPPAFIDLEDTEEIVEPVTTFADDSPQSAATDQRAQVTFRGNAYDLTSVLAIAMGILTLVSCLSCGWTFYCLPIVPVVLGLAGLLAAKQSVDAERTRLLSWLGIGGGAVGLIIMLIAIAAYVGFLALMVTVSTQGNQFPHG